MTEYVFSYGTLQLPELQLKLFGRVVTGTNDILTGYKLLPIEIKDENFLSNRGEKNQLTIRRSDKSADLIEGTLLELTAEELKIADAYEPANYKRAKVQTKSGKPAWIYMAV